MKEMKGKQDSMLHERSVHRIHGAIASREEGCPSLRTHLIRTSDEGFQSNSGERLEIVDRTREIVEEIRRQLWLAGPLVAKTWTGFSKEAFHGVLEFLRLGIPSAVMVCLEYWSFEMVVLLSGLLPHPKVEMSVLSISVNTMWVVYMIPFGLSSALSNEEEVVKYVARMMPVLATSNFLDGIQCLLSGIARGCGWQKMCAFVNLGAYYGVGLPCAVLFAFVFHINGVGLWMGIVCGLLVQVVFLLTITFYTDWNREARKARDRVCGSNIAVHIAS
ncbi:hypothetical protein ACLOJK_032889 [Asimina triloba]